MCALLNKGAISLSTSRENTESWCKGIIWAFVRLEWFDVPATEVLPEVQLLFCFATNSNTKKRNIFWYGGNKEVTIQISTQQEDRLCRHKLLRLAFYLVPGLNHPIRTALFTSYLDFWGKLPVPSDILCYCCLINESIPGCMLVPIVFEDLGKIVSFIWTHVIMMAQIFSLSEG